MRKHRPFDVFRHVFPSFTSLVIVSFELRENLPKPVHVMQASHYSMWHSQGLLLRDTLHAHCNSSSSTTSWQKLNIAKTMYQKATETRWMNSLSECEAKGTEATYSAARLPKPQLLRFTPRKLSSAGGGDSHTQLNRFSYMSNRPTVKTWVGFFSE